MDPENGQIRYPTAERKRRTALLIVCVVAVVLVGIGFISVVHRLTGVPPTLSVIPTPTPDPMAPKNVLLLGYGGAGHDGGLLTDTMILAHIVPKEKKLILISIPRDVWVSMEVKEGTQSSYKINAAYAIGSDDKAYPKKPEKYKGDQGGLTLAEEAVKTVTGLPVDFAAALDFSGFSGIMKTLGGIFIEVPYEFEDKLYPVKGKEKDTCGKPDDEIQAVTATMSGTLLEEQFPCRYETLKFEKGKQFMDGETALKFVRSRHSEVGGGDFGRSLRQQAFLMGVKNRLLSFEGITKIVPLVKDGLGMVHTDFSFQDAQMMLERYGSVSSYTVESVFLNDQTVFELATSDDMQSILIPKTGIGDWNSIHAYIAGELTRLSEASESAVIK